MATYAVPGSKFDGSIREICDSVFGAPVTLPYTLVNVTPPFWLTCKLPSSVPTQMTPGFDGDSRMIVMFELLA